MLHPVTVGTGKCNRAEAGTIREGNGKPHDHRPRTRFSDPARVARTPGASRPVVGRTLPVPRASRSAFKDDTTRFPIVSYLVPLLDGVCS